MYKITPLIIYLVLALKVQSQTKVVGECSIQFSIEQAQFNEWKPIGQKNIWIKGSQCKTVLISAQLQQTLIFNLQKDSAIILKDIGANHFLQQIPYPPNTQSSLVAMHAQTMDSSSFLGYACKKVQIEFSDGAIYDIIYTPEIIPTVPYFEFAFKEIPGLVLSYTISNTKGVKLRYTAIAIDLNPITLSQFEVNKLKYQIID